jgi:hypothetical protein
VKEAYISKLYIQALALAEHSKDASRLRDWKTPGPYVYGEFTQVLYDVIKSRCTAKGPSAHTIQDVNQLIDSITQAKDL